MENWLRTAWDKIQGFGSKVWETLTEWFQQPPPAEANPPSEDNSSTSGTAQNAGQESAASSDSPEQAAENSNEDSSQKESWWDKIKSGLGKVSWKKAGIFIASGLGVFLGGKALGALFKGKDKDDDDEEGKKKGKGLFHKLWGLLTAPFKFLGKCISWVFKNFFKALLLAVGVMALTPWVKKMFRRFQYNRTTPTPQSATDEINKQSRVEALNEFIHTPPPQKDTFRSGGQFLENDHIILGGDYASLLDAPATTDLALKTYLANMQFNLEIRPMPEDFKGQQPAVFHTEKDENGFDRRIIYVRNPPTSNAVQFALLQAVHHDFFEADGVLCKTRGTQTAGLVGGRSAGLSLEELAVLSQVSQMASYAKSHVDTGSSQALFEKLLRGDSDLTSEQKAMVDKMRCETALVLARAKGNKVVGPGNQGKFNALLGMITSTTGIDVQRALPNGNGRQLQKGFWDAVQNRNAAFYGTLNNYLNEMAPLYYVEKRDVAKLKNNIDKLKSFSEVPIEQPSSDENKGIFYARDLDLVTKTLTGKCPKIITFPLPRDNCATTSGGGQANNAASNTIQNVVAANLPQGSLEQPDRTTTTG